GRLDARFGFHATVRDDDLRVVGQRMNVDGDDAFHRRKLFTYVVPGRPDVNADAMSFFERPQETRGRVDREQPPVVNDGHAPADQRDLGQDVRAEQHRVVLAEGANRFARLLGLTRIRAGRRLT